MATKPHPASEPNRNPAATNDLDTAILALLARLLERIRRTYEAIFADADSLIEDAIEEARKLTQSSRGELQRVRAQIGQLDKKIGSMTRLLVDPDAAGEAQRYIDAAAKRAVSRQVGELEAKREWLQQAVAKLANDANGNMGRLAGAVRQALAEAQKSLATVATPTEMRAFIESARADLAEGGQYVGPMVLKPSGDIGRKETAPPAETQTAPAEAEAVERSIAGARSVPLQLREAFWQRFGEVA